MLDRKQNEGNRTIEADGSVTIVQHHHAPRPVSFTKATSLETVGVEPKKLRRTCKALAVPFVELPGGDLLVHVEAFERALRERPASNPTRVSDPTDADELDLHAAAAASGLRMVGGRGR